MSDPATGLLARLASSVVWRALSSVWGRFQRPSYQLKRAPENIFLHLRPHTSLATAREILGTPIREYANRQSFRFSDAFIQIGVTEDKAISYVCLVIPRVTRRTTFRVYPLHFVLGKSTMKDASWGEEPSYEFDNSSKHWQVWTKQYFGYYGNYLHYAFGVLGAPNVTETPIRWNKGEDNVDPIIQSPPNEIVPNMVWVSSEKDFHPSFDFWAFH